MRLVIDCFKLVKGAGKSIGIYNLAKSLTIHLGERRQEHSLEDEIIVLGNSYNREEFDVPGITFIECKGNPLNKLYCIWWELIGVVGKARRLGADRILFPRGFRPLSCGHGSKKIRDTIIIHDLIPFFYDKQYPGYFNRLENAYIMNRLRASMRGADRIITISECSRKDIVSRVPESASRIAVIHNGFNDVTFQSKVQKGEYIVAMTSGLPHKNAAGVLKAYEAYRKKSKNPLSLVVIGVGDAAAYPGLSKEVLPHIRFYKFMKKFDDMCRLIAGGKAYLFLSYAEGFGFPPLEAMQLGLPVVCSDRSSLPEVVGDAALLVNPDDLAAVVEALEAVTTDEGLRKELIEKGYQNIKRFSWESRTESYWKELFE